MKYFINDQALNTEQQITLRQALDHYFSNTSNDQTFVIALNQNFVPRSEYSATLLSNGDKIELLSPMAGG